MNIRIWFLADGRLFIKWNQPLELYPTDSSLIIHHSSLAITVDADLLRQPLTLRPWRAGDRFCPFGMKQSRLVSDFLKDSKLNLIEKRHVYALLDAEGRIVWLVGLRADNRFRVTAATRRTLRLTCA